MYEGDLIRYLVRVGELCLNWGCCIKGIIKGVLYWIGEKVYVVIGRIARGKCEIYLWD